MVVIVDIPDGDTIVHIHLKKLHTLKKDDL